MVKKIFILFLISISGLFAQNVTGSNLTINGNGRVNGTFYSPSIATARLMLQGYGTFYTPNTHRILNDFGLFDGASMGSNSFLDDWQYGYGWRLAYQDTGYSLTLDNLFIRGNLYAHEFLIDQTKTSTGDFLATSSGMIDSVKFHMLPGANWFTTEDVTGHNVSPFWSGDIIICQRVNTSGATFNSNGDYDTTSFLIKRLIYKVDSTNGLKVYYSNLAGAPVNVAYIQKGDVFVRIGNTSLSSNRNGSIGLYVNQPGSPYLRVVDSVNSWSAWKNQNNIKVQLGKLDSLNIPEFGGYLKGYGLYSNNVYLKGKIVLTGGSSIASGIALWDSIGNRPSYVFPPQGLIRWDSLTTTFNSVSSIWNLVGKGLFIDATHMGYFDANSYPNSPWRTYMDSSGNFYLTRVNGDELSWSNGHLSITSGGTAFSTLASTQTLHGDSLISHNTRIIQNTDSVNIFSTRTISHGDSIKSLRGSLNIASNQINLEVSNRLADSINIHSTLTLNANNITSLVDSVATHRNLINSNSTSITQNANNILLKADKTTADSLGNRISGTEASITVNSNNITSLVDSNSVYRGLLNSYGTSISQNTNNISLQATHLGYLDDSVTAHRTAINLSDSVLSLKASSSTVNNIWNQVHSDSAQIIVNSTGISNLVTSTNQLNDSITVHRSAINQYANSISLEVSRRLSDSTNIHSSLTLNANNISTEVSRRLSDSTTIHSSLTQNANDILLKVSKTSFTGDTLLSYINLDPSSVKISASKIQIDGTTTFSSGYDPSTKTPYSDTSNAANHINWNTTTINGNKLTTGTVIADSIRSSYLYSKTLVGGNISGTTISGGSITTTNPSTLYSTVLTGGELDVSLDGTHIGTFMGQNNGAFMTATDGIASVLAQQGGLLALNGNSLTWKGHALNFSDLAGTISNAQLNLGTTTAPSAISSSVNTSIYYGTNSAVLTTPAHWLILYDASGNSYKVPAY